MQISNAIMGFLDAMTYDIVRLTQNPVNDT